MTLRIRDSTTQPMAGRYMPVRGCGRSARTRRGLTVLHDQNGGEAVPQLPSTQSRTIRCSSLVGSNLIFSVNSGSDQMLLIFRVMDEARKEVIDILMSWYR